MKRFLLLLFMSMLLCGTIHSQISLLVEAGGNYGRTDISGVDLLEQENIASYYFAVTPKLPLTNSVNAFTEIQYSREGADVFYNGAADPEAFRVYYFRLIPGVEIDIAGPFSILAGINLGVATVENLDGRVLNGPSGIDIRTYDRSDYGALFGVNFNFEGLNFVVKYNLGLKDVIDINFTDIEGNELSTNSRNRFLQVGVGYEFGF